METATSPEISKLKTQIQALTELKIRVQQLRNVPTLLLRTASSGIPVVPIKTEFQNVKDLADGLCSDNVQDALRYAKESEERDKSELHMDPLRDNRKRKRAPSPDSPKSYTSHQPKSMTSFPVMQDGQEPLRADGLVDYIKEFNASHKSKLHIWNATYLGKGKLTNPAIIRFSIPDVLVAYCSLAHEGQGQLLVESVTASGPREAMKPHCQSEYAVYQKLSQQIAKMIQSHPYVSFQELMHLMVSYETLFLDRCSNCQRVLSLEGHIPPIARVWISIPIDGEGWKWDPRHVNCLHS